MTLTSVSYYYYYLSVLHNPAACSTIGGVVPTCSRVCWSTRLCPINFYLATTISPAISSTLSSSTFSSPLYTSVFRSLSISIFAYSHQFIVTDDPCLLWASSRIPCIGISAMYWAIVCCSWVIYPSTVHYSASSISSPMVGYTQHFLIGY